MIKNLLSVIIPSRDPRYLQKTIDDLLNKAGGEIEIIVVLDGLWHDPMPKEDIRVVIVHHGTQFNNKGMRESINKGMALACGEFVMKIDEHCMLDQGYDIKLKADCEEDWVVIPRRKRLDPDKWEIIEDGRPPVDYMKIDYPYAKPLDKTQGLHGSEDKQRFNNRKDILIDDVMTGQGSCYFLPKKLWDSVIVRLEDENYGPFTQEIQEICNKVWLIGGSVKVNKKTFYGHWHKGSSGRNYSFSNEQYVKHSEGNEKGRLFGIDFWVNNRWDRRKYDFKYLIDKFWPIPGWPENWEEQIIIDKKNDYSTLNYEGDHWLRNLKK